MVIYMNLIHGECIAELSKLPSKSVDFVYLDLPYGQTSCKWDVKLDLGDLWIQLKRIAKNDRTPFFFSCTTKFGFELIKANEKWFRWDLVWKKNRAAGFLNAYRLPMRKHEMVYCFAKQSPEYDVSSHTDNYTTQENKANRTNTYAQEGSKHKKEITAKLFKDPLPTSDITPPTSEHELVYCFAKKSPEYDVSSHKELDTDACIKEGFFKHEPGVDLYNKKTVKSRNTHKDRLPDSDITPPTSEHELVYCFAKKSPEYDVSSHSEYTESANKHIRVKEDDMNGRLYGGKVAVKCKVHNDPLPTSDITPPELDPNGQAEMYGIKKTGKRNQGKKDQDPLPNSDITPPSERTDNHYGLKSNKHGKTHKDPLPNSDITPSSWCEFKNDEKTGHRTAKPVALMEFLLKYWTKPDWVVLDPTMGSGSMGIACKKMGRSFIGIEMDDDIYKLAQKRVGEAIK